MSQKTSLTFWKLSYLNQIAFGSVIAMHDTANERQKKTYPELILLLQSL